MSHIPRLGALVEEDGVRFRVWAPKARRVSVVLGEQRRAHSKSVPLHAAGEDTYEAFLEGVPAGTLYHLQVDDGPLLPDPASRYQPQGVHGPSEVVDPRSFAWSDGRWRPPPLASLTFYELHVGTFTPEGSFAAAQRRLRHLAELGVGAAELMPVADFPGMRNWGYDPAALWAPSRAYGRPDDLRALVNEAHGLGLAVFLDVIYNHLGPDGAYAAHYGPMFTGRHQTPWGDAINLDGDGSAGVRAFLIRNALDWLTEYHFDGLRLDATYALRDESAKHFLAELAEEVALLFGPRRLLIAEDGRNLALVVRPIAEGGYGLDGQWSDDFHHLVRRIAAGDRHGYFADFNPSAADLARTIERGWHYMGQRSAHEGRPRGTDPGGLSMESFVFFLQNHDQIGNRAQGDRLHHAIDLATYRALSALLLFLPELPLLFMGQEWAAGSPFCYFTDHEEALGRLVREGRRREFERFPEFQGEVPDPQDVKTFLSSKLDWKERQRTPHAGIERLYQDLLRMRRELGGKLTASSPCDGAVTVTRGPHRLAVALRSDIAVPLPSGRLLWHSEQPAYSGEPRPPFAAAGTLHFVTPAATLWKLE